MEAPNISPRRFLDLFGSARIAKTAQFGSFGNLGRAVGSKTKSVYEKLKAPARLRDFALCWMFFP